jgi:hypothetical protein
MWLRFPTFLPSGRVSQEVEAGFLVSSMTLYVTIKREACEGVRCTHTL